MYNMESHSELRLDNENKNPIIQAIDQNRPLHTTHNRGRFHIKQIHSSNSSYPAVLLHKVGCIIWTFIAVAV